MLLWSTHTGLTSVTQPTTTHPTVCFFGIWTCWHCWHYCYKQSNAKVKCHNQFFQAHPHFDKQRVLIGWQQHAKEWVYMEWKMKIPVNFNKSTGYDLGACCWAVAAAVVQSGGTFAPASVFSRKPLCAEVTDSAGVLKLLGVCVQQLLQVQMG